MSINNLTDEEILKLVLIDENQYYTLEYIKNRLKLFQDLFFLSEEKINSCLITINNDDAFLNIDLYYEKFLTEKQIKKMNPSEIIRYIVRNTYKDSRYGNFHNVEYHFIKSIIMNGFIKLHLSKNKMGECLEYLENHLNDMYDYDRYIINPLVAKEKRYVIYDKIIYKMKNIFIVYDEINHYYCIRHRVNKSGEISLYGDISQNKYYQNIIYDYYDVKTGEFIYQSNSELYWVESLQAYNNILDINEKTISLKNLEKRINVPIYIFGKPKKMP